MLALDRAVSSALVYLNFFTSHVTWDARLHARARAAVRDEADVGALHRRPAQVPDAARAVLRPHRLLPLAAENAATPLRAWQYPSQESAWTLVHAAKLGSWSLPVVVSIVLVATIKAREGQLYGTAGSGPSCGATTCPRNCSRNYRRQRARTGPDLRPSRPGELVR